VSEPQRTVQEVSLDQIGVRKSPIKSTISIPTSLSQTKKLFEEKSATKTEATAQEIPVESEPKSDTPAALVLTQELLAPHFFTIQEFFRKAGRQMEVAILDQPIQVRDNGEVVLEVMGHVQEEIAGKMKPDLVGLIRQLTGVERVVITLELREEVDNGKPKLYTNTDKLNYLREKHPALAEFQRKFGLDVDF
jgi:hypothetical protein